MKLAASLERDLPRDEWQRVKTMIGQVFEVTEIDDYGAAWVERVWLDESGDRSSHSVALAPDEMEVV